MLKNGEKWSEQNSQWRPVKPIDDDHDTFRYTLMLNVGDRRTMEVLLRVSFIEMKKCKWKTNLWWTAFPRQFQARAKHHRNSRNNENNALAHSHTLARTHARRTKFECEIYIYYFWLFERPRRERERDVPHSTSLKRILTGWNEVKQYLQHNFYSKRKENKMYRRRANRTTHGERIMEKTVKRGGEETKQKKKKNA